MIRGHDGVGGVCRKGAGGRVAAVVAEAGQAADEHDRRVAEQFELTLADLAVRDATNKRDLRGRPRQRGRVEAQGDERLMRGLM